MFRWIKRKAKFATQKVQKNNHCLPAQAVFTQLSENISYVKQIFRESSDIVYHSFNIGKNQEIKAAIVSIDGLFDKTELHEHVLKPLQGFDLKDYKNEEMTKRIERECFQVLSVHKSDKLDDSILLLTKGDSLLFIDGQNKVFVIGARAFEVRSIDEPVTETVVRGPREGFVETLRTNTSMLRRKIHSPQLQIEQMTLGTVTQTEVAIAFMQSIVAPEILQEVRRRLKRIKIDSILESGYIEELIEDAPFSPFATIGNTERPDVVAAKILEGRIAIMVDGTPTALIVPHLMFESIQSAEDYYSRPYYSSLVRLLRILGFMVTTLVPALYIGTQDYHKEIFPTELLITIAAAREGVPFPLSMEVLLLLIGFEWLREAGVRMPKPLGQAVSIVGALILGQSAVDAGFVGAPTVIVIAVTAITSFMLPSMSDTAAILRFIYLFCASILGVYGIMLAVCFFLLHVASLRSFGIPYMSPLLPIEISDWKDFLIRSPLWELERRPDSLKTINEVRQKKEQKPQTLSEKKER